MKTKCEKIFALLSQFKGHKIKTHCRDHTMIHCRDHTMILCCCSLSGYFRKFRGSVLLYDDGLEHSTLVHIFIPNKRFSKSFNEGNIKDFFYNKQTKILTIQEKAIDVHTNYVVSTSIQFLTKKGEPYKTKRVSRYVQTGQNKPSNRRSLKMARRFVLQGPTGDVLKTARVNIPPDYPSTPTARSDALVDAIRDAEDNEDIILNVLKTYVKRMIQLNKIESLMNDGYLEVQNDKPSRKSKRNEMTTIEETSSPEHEEINVDS